MNKTVRIGGALLAALAGVVAILMIMWPAWLGPADQLLPWNATGWQLFVSSPDGHAYPVPNRTYLLIAVTLLLGMTVMSSALTLIDEQEPPSSPAQTATRNEVSGDVGAEVVRVLSHMRTYLEANGLFNAVLARANEELPKLENPEQLRMVISYLVLENDNMKKKSSNLQASLEHSKRQIDQLRANLAVAKVEGLSDPLTGVKNRRGFDITLASEIADARKNQRPLSLVLADIDHFKLVNDTHGHPAGDEVLKWFATLLSRNVKGRDTVTRFGGEEFAIILPQTPSDAATRVANLIKAQIDQQEFVLPGKEKISIKVTSSFGVAQWRDGETSDSFVKRTDSKLYEAKASGRNRVAA